VDEIVEVVPPEDDEFALRPREQWAECGDERQDPADDDGRQDDRVVRDAVPL
jgi:hypothetical protein